MLWNISTEEELISLVFPSNILHISETCLSRAILVPTNKQIDHYNHLIYTILTNNSCIYLTTDSLKNATNANIMPPILILTWLCHDTFSSRPTSCYISSQNQYCILKNLSIERGLVKNTRVSITCLSTRLIGIHLLTNNRPFGKEILLPHITFTATLLSHHTLLQNTISNHSSLYSKNSTFHASLTVNYIQHYLEYKSNLILL